MRKIPTYIPKIFITLFILSILPIPIFRPYFNFIFGAPVQYFLGWPDQSFENQLKLEETLFPTEPDPWPQIYNGTDHSIMIDNPEYEKIMAYNQSQREKRFEYRRTHPQKPEPTLLQFLRIFAPQVTIITLFIMCSLLSLIQLKKKNQVLVNKY